MRFLKKSAELLFPLLLVASTAFALDLKSPAFENGATIPLEYTCKGGDSSPELE